MRGAPPPVWVRRLPLLLLVALTVFQIVVRRRVELGFLIGAIPPLAALSYGAFGTAVFSGVVLVLLWVPAIRLGHPARSDLLTVAFVAVLSVLIAWVRSRRDAQLVTVRTVAEAAQFAVLPPLPPRVGPVRCAGLYRAAQHGTLVGGDLFDVRDGPYGVRALVGDVQGHGLAAVGTVAALLGAFREAVLDQPELSGVAAQLDRRLTVDTEAATREALLDYGGSGEVYSELFATAVLLEFPVDSAQVRIVSCGHPPPLLLGQAGRTARELTAPPGPPLGLGVGPAQYKPLTVAMEPGDQLLAMTDGVTETRDRAGTFYPLLERAVALRDDDPSAFTDALWVDLVAYAHGDITDDVALLVFAPDPEDRRGASARREGKGRRV
ncbi:PP2C family protein-serine/threonine phosphatase [Streptomyces sp. NPDC007088]|uniref:PP2C family protein-serine/threonine phosphatase n=1 Tax=Streptomyces sp. NPDC007088 TaxID=3364773 RepID=UPI00368B3F81